jgi:hypothetical protein
MSLGGVNQVRCTFRPPPMRASEGGRALHLAWVYAGKLAKSTAL